MSRDYTGKRVVVWPVYIDSTITRRGGRRVPISDAVPNPSVEEIVRAAEELGLNPTIEDSRYPRLWWRFKQRVIVDKRAPKQQLLRMIARKVKELRSSKR